MKRSVNGLYKHFRDDNLMGYTHYFRQERHATDKEWFALCSDFTKLRASALITTHVFPIQREYDDAAEVVINSEEIRFNGIGEDGHETMLMMSKGDGFQFCKTAEKPYDEAVKALLILAHHHAPGCWSIQSDGGLTDWQPTLDWMNTLGLGTFVLPPDLREES